MTDSPLPLSDAACRCEAEDWRIEDGRHHPHCPLWNDPGEWMLVQPGGPAGPFWGIVSASGPGWVVVLQAASEGFARLIVTEHNKSLAYFQTLPDELSRLRADLTAAQEVAKHWDTTDLEAERDGLAERLEKAEAALRGFLKVYDYGLLTLADEARAVLAASKEEQKSPGD